jgi:hypothetical protein
MEGSKLKNTRNKKLVDFIDRQKKIKNRAFLTAAAHNFNISKQRAAELYAREKRKISSEV